MLILSHSLFQGPLEALDLLAIHFKMEYFLMFHFKTEHFHASYLSLSEAQRQDAAYKTPGDAGPCPLFGLVFYDFPFFCLATLVTHTDFLQFLEITTPAPTSGIP